jgi:hypothetical protein
MSTLSLRKIKHDSSAVDNIVTNSDGGVGLGGIDPSTLPGFIDHAIKVQNGGGLGIQSANATDNRWIFFGNGTTSGDVQRAGIVNQGSDQSLALATGGTQRLIVDASGRVTMPYQPAFYAYGGGFQNTTNSVVQFTTVHTNRGSCYNNSTYRFTAPVTGAYAFHYAAMTDGGGYNRYVIRVNGTAVGGTMFASSDAYENFSGHWILQLNTNDYVDIFGTADVLIHPDYRTFSGHLIG